MSERSTPHNPQYPQNDGPPWDGFTIEGRDEVATRLPAIYARVQRAWHGRIPRACRHVLAGCAPAILSCGQHPEAGCWCEPCARDHAAGHTELEELACDECGTVETTTNPRLIVVPGTRRVLGLDGRKRKVDGLFAVFGLGVCSVCHRRVVAA